MILESKAFELLGEVQQKLVMRARMTQIQENIRDSILESDAFGLAKILLHKQNLDLHHLHLLDFANPKALLSGWRSRIFSCI